MSPRRPKRPRRSRGVPFGDGPLAAWLDREGAAGSAQQRLRLLERGLESVWARAAETLGDVTVTVVAHRALLVATHKQPLLAGLTVRDGFELAQWRKASRPRGAKELEAALLALLQELVRLLSAITSGILEPVLLKHLATVTVRRKNAAAPHAKGRGT